jgi:hypothetical protein
MLSARLYDWTSTVLHKGLRVHDAMLWYVLFFINARVLPRFVGVTTQDIDIILQELKNQNQIDLV